MTLHTTIIKKILLGAVLIGIAAGITLVIKENLDTKDPESALPRITVSYNGAPLSDDAVLRAGFEWNFLTTKEKGPTLNVDDLPLHAVDVLPQVPVTVSFSKTPDELKISRSEGRGSQDFIEITSEKSGEILTPTVPNVYTYKVEASWHMRGSVLYYFSVQTKEL
ncbi:MAG: hypothetical protein RR573_05275 [Oscillospiraceae bacterium]